MGERDKEGERLFSLYTMSYREYPPSLCMLLALGKTGEGGSICFGVMTITNHKCHIGAPSLHFLSVIQVYFWWCLNDCCTCMR